MFLKLAFQEAVYIDKLEEMVSRPREMEYDKGFSLV